MTTIPDGAQSADPVREAAQALLAKIDAAEPYIENLCLMEHNRGRPYRGPTFGSEKEALRTALAAPEGPAPTITAEMVNRFLSWPLPKDFCPDCGIAFDGRKDDQWNKNKTWPIGTNLFSADQARAMLEHAVGSVAAQPHLDHQVGAPVAPLPLDSAGGAGRVSPTLMCPTCGADRYKEPCRNGNQNCPIKGDPQ